MLLLISSLVFFYRWFYLGVPLQPQEEVSSFTVEASLKFYAKAAQPIKARFIIPHMPPYFATLDEYFVSNNYGVTTNREGYNRETVWSIRRAQGLQSMYYRAIYRFTGKDEFFLPEPKRFKKMELKDSELSAVQAISALARKSSADIETFAQATVKLLKNDKDNVRIIVGNAKGLQAEVEAAIKILNQAKIHALHLRGLALNPQKHATMQDWLAVYDGHKWLMINPKTGAKSFPDKFLIWAYGSGPLYHVTGGNKASFNLTVSPTNVSALSLAKMRGTATESRLLQFSLLQLPLNVQQTYKILLTVPIGCFIILLLRNFIGLVTFGTFMPVLIALAFRETHVIMGTILFSTIVSFGLLARFYLNQLQLLMVPRLAVILTVVIFLMIIISVLSLELGSQSGLSVALFPMVILTMVIERMCITCLLIISLCNFIVDFLNFHTLFL